MGTKRTTGDKPADIDPSQPLEIAHYDQSATYKNKRFEGDMDEFMMFDYAWTAEEVDGVFAASKNYLSGDGAVALASFGRLNVSSIRGFDGTVTGDGVVGFGDDAVVDFGDATAPLVLFDHPFALGKNVTISTTATQDRHLIAKASSFTGVDNLQTWTATVGNREYYFRISADGTELYLTIQSGSLLMFR